MRRLRLCVNKVRMHTSRIGRATQARYGLEMANKVVSESAAKVGNINAHPSGQALFGFIPPDMCSYVTNTWFDPYVQDLDKEDILAWLWDHVVFGPSGEIIAIHDRGSALVYAEGWAEETDWFIRVKNAQWRKIERKNDG